MINIFLTCLCVVPLIIYFIYIKKHKFTIKEMATIGVFGAISYILSLIYIVYYPQGGGFNLLPSLPILLMGVIYSKEAGVTTGLIAGIFSMVLGGYIINPAQAILDYILPFMTLGMAGIFGYKNKFKLLGLSIIIVIISTIFHVLAGVIFFGSLAPEGVSPFMYSLIYNFSGTGLEGLLSAIVMCILPIHRLKKV